MSSRILGLAFGAGIVFLALSPAHSDTQANRVTQSAIGREYMHVLGAQTLAPSSGLVGALVALPPSARASDYGLDDVAPGIGRLRGTTDMIDAFGAAHPALRIEVAPPLHPLNDRVSPTIFANIARARGFDGTGVEVGVADTGLDVTHNEFRDENGKTRVAWLLDLSLPPAGLHADLENRFAIKDSFGRLVQGAVFAREDIDKLLGAIDDGSCVEDATTKCAPNDVIGHGTHVTGIATSTGAKKSPYKGVAPGADVVFVRVTRGKSDGIENDDLVRAVQFMFDRADADKKPMVVNLSLGSDFGPHDGTFMWEKVIAAYVGPDHPGHAVVAAAGNSGSIAEGPIHQSVHVAGAKMRVPITIDGGADGNADGSVQVWVTLRPNANLHIGLDGPDGEWIAPVEEGHQGVRNTSKYNAGVIYGSNVTDSPIPDGSHGGVIVWTGTWPLGTYAITLEGEGTAELYLQSIGAGTAASGSASFAHGVREGTINLPATHPAIIGVGCTVNRPRWTSITTAEVGLRQPLLDHAGGLPVGKRIGADGGALPTFGEIHDGEVCWFSSAGPTAMGVPKPEIAAPGGLVISAMSRGAKPGTAGSIFNNSNCPPTKTGKTDARCMQVDDNHAIALGTSMSSPVVAGSVALMFQKDPTLTQDKIVALLQAGAHPFRGASPFADQAGPGEVDVVGSLDAIDQMHDPLLALPSARTSWITLSEDYVAADGSTPLTAIVELRNEAGDHRADLFDQNRLAAVLEVDGAPFPTTPTIMRRGPGVWTFAWTPPPGLGGARAKFGATFDGQPIVTPKFVPIAVDGWNAAYPSHAGGSGCGVGGRGDCSWALFALLALAVIRRRG